MEGVVVGIGTGADKIIEGLTSGDVVVLLVVVVVVVVLEILEVLGTLGVEGLDQGRLNPKIELVAVVTGADCVVVVVLFVTTEGELEPDVDPELEYVVDE